MSEKVVLKVLRCPTCGVSLKSANDKDAIVCVYCGNTIIPVRETQCGGALENGTHVRVEGIKTSSSALAYMDLFFEEYDWDSFMYGQTLTVPEIDKLANSLKSTSADDKNTWIACFTAISVPFLKKIEGCKKILETAIDEYKEGSFEAYSQFDAYKRISNGIYVSKNEIIQKLEKNIANAKKYGASDAELSKLSADIARINESVETVRYNDIEKVPEIQSFRREKDREIETRLMLLGINASAEYERAKMLINSDEYVEALDVLRKLEGYADSSVIIENLDRYYTISNVIEIDMNLYYLHKNAERDVFDLYPAVKGNVSAKAMVKGIKKVVGNYANILYFVDEAGRLKKCDLSNGNKKILCANVLLNKGVYTYQKNIFLTAGNSSAENRAYNVVAVDLASGKAEVFVKGINSIVGFAGSKMIYTAKKKPNSITSKLETIVIDVNDRKSISLGTKKVKVEGVLKNHVIYTQNSPNKYNKNIYAKSFNCSSIEILIEKNIYEFCDIIGGKLFYYVGNAKNKSLIKINFDGGNRKEWPLYVGSLLFEQSGWIYFIRRAGYNSVLCKSRADGSQYSVIARDIEEFVEIKNGYLYYIDDESSLVRVRMDGSNLHKLCANVEKVLAVKENKVVFVSTDGDVTYEHNGMEKRRGVKSIYAVEFNGSGKIKLAYDVKEAKKYGENTVYYIAGEEINKSFSELEERAEVLYSLDVESNVSQKLLVLPSDDKGGLSPLAIALIVAGLASLLSVIGFISGVKSLGIFGVIVALVSVIVGAIWNSGAQKADNSED